MSGPPLGREVASDPRPATAFCDFEDHSLRLLWIDISSSLCKEAFIGSACPSTGPPRLETDVLLTFADMVEH